MTILEIRKLTALNRAEFARRYNIPYRTIEDWEKGKSVWPPYVAELLEKVVRMDIKADMEGGKMKKYEVECKVANAEQMAGTAPRNDARIDFIGDLVEAGDEKEAVEVAKDWIFENVNNAIEGVDGAIILLNGFGEQAQELYHFRATENKQTPLDILTQCVNDSRKQ